MAQLRHIPRKSVFWLIAFLLVTLLLSAAGYWRAAGTGPQAQVPMFYDAHYLFPRPWTQAQEAPGVPDPAPLAVLYGSNQVSQPFRAGSDRLSLLRVWLAGPAGTEVQAILTDDQGRRWQGTATLAAGDGRWNNGRYYNFSFPPLADAHGRHYTLTLSAPQATADAPVTTRAVGGDRLGGSVRLNEYGRPGNLELYSYASGWPGRWLLRALGEQIYPAAFALRVQQYKPALFKGAALPILLIAAALLTAAFLILAHPKGEEEGTRISRMNTDKKIRENPCSSVSHFSFIHEAPQAHGVSSVNLHASSAYLRVTAFGLAGLALAFLVWQIGGQRLLLRPFVQTVPLTPIEAAPPSFDDGERLVHDFSLTLWTARRLPEERFVETEIYADWPAIRAPAESSLNYALVVPFNGRFHTGLYALNEGTLRFSLQWNDQEIVAWEATAGDNIRWVELDLSPWGGQGGHLKLVAEPVAGEPDALWLAPQISARHDWLQTPAWAAERMAQPAGVQFDRDVTLLGYTTPQTVAPGESLEIALYWQAQRPLDAHAVLFIHLLDEAGEIAAQLDGPPLAGTYPLAVWPPERVIVDRRALFAPDAPGVYRLAIGLYDPATLRRWTVTDENGVELPDGRLFLGEVAITQ